MVDAGFDLGKTPASRSSCCGRPAALSSLGYPLLISASNKTFLGAVLGLEIDQRREASACSGRDRASRSVRRVLRVHDVAGARRVRDALAAVIEAG